VDIPQLRCFLAVADELHFGRAAQRLHLTPSPVSRSVKDLEAELGVELFVRKYHQVELTDAGRELVGRVRHILDEIDELKPLARDFGEGQRTIRLGASHLVPPADVDHFVAVARETGGLGVHVEFGRSAELQAALREREADIILLHLPVDEPDVETAVVTRYRFKLVMRADDPLAGSPGLHLADLADRTFTLPTFTQQPMAIGRLHHIVQAAGINTVQELPTADTFRLAAHVRQNRTISFTVDPEFRGPDQIFADPAYAIVELLDDVYFEVGAVWRRDVSKRDPVIKRIAHRLSEISTPGEQA
jgi:DNA-binding transcriptional LysR family regulator